MDRKTEKKKSPPNPRSPHADSVRGRVRRMSEGETLSFDSSKLTYLRTVCSDLKFETGREYRVTRHSLSKEVLVTRTM